MMIRRLRGRARLAMSGKVAVERIERERYVH
jgi:hypothetical protein